MLVFVCVCAYKYTQYTHTYICKHKLVLVQRIGCCDILTFVCCRSETVVCYWSSCNHTDRGAHSVSHSLNQTLLQFGPPSCQKLTEEVRIPPWLFHLRFRVRKSSVFLPSSNPCLLTLSFSLSYCFWIGLVVLGKVCSRISLVPRWKLTVIAFLVLLWYKCKWGWEIWYCLIFFMCLIIKPYSNCVPESGWQYVC